MIFVDSNILIDLVEDGDWTDWSRRTLDACRAKPIVTNLIVFSEISRAFRSAADVSVFLRELGIELVAFDRDAAFRAGRAQVEYRWSGGKHVSILADFLIGAHATTLSASLVSRDKRRFGTYFPELTLITPENEDD